MGFVPERTQYRLTFTDTKYADLQVTMTGMSVGEYLDTLEVAGNVLDSKALEVASQAGDMARVIALFGEIRDQAMGVYETFAKHLVAWNVDDAEGAHVPETLDGIRTQDQLFIRDVMQAWRTGIASVDTPLGQPLSDGDMSQELSLPMEISSPNLES